jgi:acyl transferase domain-containing protein
MLQIDPGVKQLMASAFSAIDQTQILASADVRQRTAVIVGDSGGCREVLWSQVSRVAARRAETSFHRAVARTGDVLPAESMQAIAADLVRDMTAGRPAITEDSIVGIATSIGAARITKSLDLMGTHMAVDAACGSSLAAITIAVRGLQSRKWDAVITGGVAGGFTPHVAVLASKARALSATGSRPFDAHADGFVPGEGSCVRPEASERCDPGRGPDPRRHPGVGRVDRQARALHRLARPSRQAPRCHGRADGGLIRRACARGVPCDIHSRGRCGELQALGQVFGARAERSLGLGSVKAQISIRWPRPAAGLLKTLLGFERKALPPMPGAVAELIAGAGRRSHLVTTATPWTTPTTGEPRRGRQSSAASAARTGVVVEEYARLSRGPVGSPVVPAVARHGACSSRQAQRRRT